MTSSKLPRKLRTGRALGLAVAFATTPASACTVSHSPPTPDVALDADGAAAEDASVDALAAMDDGALDAGAPLDAADPYDAELPDAEPPDAYYYPDGIRG